MEIWDLFDLSRNPLFQTHQRGVKMKDGEYRIDVEIWTVDRNKNILLTLRDPQKEHYPDKWESTGGSVLSGETSRQAAIRELHEETGIIASEDELYFLGTCLDESAFVDIYLLRRNISISQLTMQEGETVDAKWVTLDQLFTMINDKSLAFPIGLHLESVMNNFQKQISII